jgi:AcrR family transcriptional regulator
LWPRLTALRSDLGAALRAAQGRGLIPEGVAVDAAAVLLRAHLFGPLVIDLHPPLTPEVGRAVAEELRQGAHLTVLQQAAPERPGPAVGIGRVTQPLRSPEVELDDLGERLLAETVRLIDSAGESAARVVDVVRAVGVNVSQLHRRFGDVQSLVVLAQAQRLAGLMMQDVDTLASRPIGQDRAALRAAMAQLSRQTVVGDRRQTRLRRLSALGASFQRPDLQAVAAAVHVGYFRRHVRALQGIAESHALPCDPLRLSMWTTATLFGLTLADAEFDPIEPEPLVGIIHDLWMRMLRASTGGNAPAVKVGETYEAATLEPLPAQLPPLASTSPRNATSDAIVAAAEQLLRSDGPAGTTPVRIAQLADVNDATISYYFRTRELLHQALLQKASEERLVRLRQTLGSLARADDADWLAGLVAWWEHETLAESASAAWRQLRALAACEPQLGDAIGDADAALVAQLAAEFGVAVDDPRMQAFTAAWEALQLLMLGTQAWLPSSTKRDAIVKLAQRLRMPVVAELGRALVGLRAAP